MASEMVTCYLPQDSGKGEERSYGDVFCKEIFI